MVYKRRRSYSSPGSGKRRKTYRRRRPYRGTYRKTYRRTRSSARGTVPTRAVNTRCVGIPRKMITQMTFRSYNTLVTGAGGTGSVYTYRLNSIYDPDLSGVGHQPRYFDQLVNANMYQGYLVYKVDVEITFRNRFTNDCMAGVNAGLSTAWPTALSPSTFFTSGELPRTTTRVLNNPTDGGPGHVWRYKATYRPHALFGVTKSSYYADDSYRGSTTTNPISQCYLHVAVADDPMEGAQQTADYEIYIKYYVVLVNNYYSVPQST